MYGKTLLALAALIGLVVMTQSAPAKNLMESLDLAGGDESDDASDLLYPDNGHVDMPDYEDYEVVSAPKFKRSLSCFNTCMKGVTDEHDMAKLIRCRYVCTGF